MVLKHASVSDAYSVLELEQGATLEQVKASYKQLALRTHPDKNPDNPEATEKFQQVGAAYNTLLRHLDRPSVTPSSHGFHFQSSFGAPDEDYGDNDSDDYDYYDDDDSEYEDPLQFYMFIFEELLKGRGGRQTARSFRRAPQTETEEQFQDRLRRTREEQKAAAERRIRGEQLRKEAARERAEKDQKEAEQRQKLKAERKKARAETSRQTAAQKIKAQRERGQALRSSVFAAARRGDAEWVKKGVWEDEVDAAGGELKAGSETSVKPKDFSETLLHIAAGNGDVELVKWLDAHNAEPEERNSAGLTAFHIALCHGYIPIVKYFLENYPPTDQEFLSIYNASPPISILRLALDSREPELVWIVLEQKLVTRQEVKEAWTWVCSEDGMKALIKTPSKHDEQGRFEEIMNLIMSYGAFTLPSTPMANPQPICGSSDKDAIPLCTAKEQYPKKSKTRTSIASDTSADIGPPAKLCLALKQSHSELAQRHRPVSQHSANRHPNPHGKNSSYQESQRPEAHQQQSTPPQVPSDLPQHVDSRLQHQPAPGRLGGRIRGRGHGRGTASVV